MTNNLQRKSKKMLKLGDIFCVFLKPLKSEIFSAHSYSQKDICIHFIYAVEFNFKSFKVILLNLLKHSILLSVHY